MDSRRAFGYPSRMSTHRRLFAMLSVVSLAGGAAVVACSSSSSSGSTPAQCNSDPWQCPAGQTCWVNQAGNGFACLNSAAGKNKGDPCQLLAGTPECGDRLLCFMPQGSTTGTCVSFCDNTKPDRTCSTGEACATVVIQSPAATVGTVSLCLPTGSPDAGTDTGGDTGVPDSSPPLDAASSDTSSDGG